VSDHDDDEIALRERFLAAVAEPERPRWSAVPGLGAALGAALREGRAAWPGVHLGGEVLVVHIAERLLPGEAADLSALATTDLYLACACARGDARALSVFDRVFVPQLAQALARLRLSPTDADEVAQAVRERLLLADGPRPPRIAQYTGQGELGAWIRVTAARVALDRLRLKRCEQPVGTPEALEPLLPEVDPDLGQLKETYRIEFRRAFAGAMGALDLRQRASLIYSLLDGLTLDKNGTLYGVHGATVSRWMASARATLLAETRRRLGEQLRIDPVEVDGVLHLLESQLDASISRLLRADRPPR
jgi:RNA polymerase sigma-70 factor (ECF subfamily)